MRALIVNLMLWTGLSWSVGIYAQSNPQAGLWRRSEVLPAGQSQFIFSTNFSRFSERRSASGDKTSLGTGYSQAITWGEILSSSGGGEKIQLQEFLQTQGLAEDTTAASTQLEVSQEVLNLSPQWAYGLTETWMVGIRLPLVYKRTQVKTKTELSDNFSKLMAQSKSQNSEALGSEMNLRAKQALNQRLQQYDYDPINEDQKEWVLGDAEFLSKQRLWQTSRALYSLRQRVSLPTASSKSPYQYVESPSGDGQMDVGLDAMMDYWVAPGWVMTASAGYTWQAPDQIKARLPGEGGENRVSEDVDYEVNRDLGDYVSAALFAENSLSVNWKFLGGYSYRRKSRDVYEGGGYSTERYETLSRESEQELHMAHLGLSYLVEPFYERHGLKKQFASSFYLSSVVAGSNVPDTTLAGFDIQFLF